MNLANKLTVYRRILVPIFVIIGYLGVLGVIQGEWLEIPVYLWIMNIIFIIASITDKLDGYIARSRNQITTFGKFLDPLADKILVISALVMLVEFGKIPGWIPIIVLFREFLVSGYRLIAVEKGGKVIAASIWGKLKTVTQMLAIILVFADKHNFFSFIFGVANTEAALQSSAYVYMSQGEMIFNIIASCMMLISVIATIFSGYDYLKNGKDLFKDTK